MKKLQRGERFSSPQERAATYKEIYDMFHERHMSQKEISEKTGYSSTQIYRIIHTFASENLEYVSIMDEKKTQVLPEDYKRLQEEILSLKKDLKQAKIRAAFYEEMVNYGKEVYGIDLKKAGTK